MKFSASVTAATAKAAYNAGKAIGTTKPKAAAAGRYAFGLVENEAAYRNSLVGIVDRWIYPRDVMAAAVVGRAVTQVALDVMGRRSGASETVVTSVKTNGRHRAPKTVKTVKTVKAS